MRNAIIIAALAAAGPAFGAEAARPLLAGAVGDTLGRALYEAGCASCHGSDGRGAPEHLSLQVPTPDFTECSFASREPDADWAAVVHAGGPVRGFDVTMPAFGEAFTRQEIKLILDYVRTFCGNPRWPRGELNLPRAHFTEKAYPEDEAVFTAEVDVESPRSTSAVVVYEKRIGPVTQVELEIPLRSRARTEEADAAFGVGDVALAVKRVLSHSLARGALLSAGAEVSLPTGSRERGFGHGTAVFEPYLAFGKLLAADAFVQLQALVEIPAKGDHAETEAVWRAAFGRTFTSGDFGRAWTPLVELLGAAEIDGGASAWDLVPQLQVTVNTRQHVIANVGVRVPVTRTDTRRPRLLLYVLWDWFDGGFFDGW